MNKTSIGTYISTQLFFGRKALQKISLKHLLVGYGALMLLAFWAVASVEITQTGAGTFMPKYTAKQEKKLTTDVSKAQALSTVYIEPKPVYIDSSDWVAQCQRWANQAGVHLNSWAIELIDRESNCDPYAQNPRSTAYGIGQFLNSTWGLNGVGCVKTSDPVRQIQCMERYVVVIYGSWQSAVAYHNMHNSY